MKEKAFLYYRVSTTSEEQDTSFIAQSNYKSENYDIVAKFGDKGTARNIKKRPSFREMLYRCNVNIKEIEGHTLFVVGDRKPEVNTILVSHTSRFMRNQLLMKQLLNTLAQNNIKVIFLDLGRSSLDSDFDFVMNVLFLLDEQESKNTSFKVKKGLERAREQRQYLHYGYGNMLGFDYIKEENKLVKNKDAEIVANIFNDYKNGESVRSLSAKYGYNQNKILRILDNEKYAGQIAYNKWENKNDKKVRVKDYTYFETDRIEKIISLELFEECQKIKDSRKQGNRRKGINTYSLTGKIKCKCGSNFFHHDKKGGYSSWKCLNKHNNNACDIPSINENTILKYLKSDYGLSALKNGFKFRIDNAIYELKVTEDIFVIENRIKPLEEKLERLKRLFVIGDISEEEYIQQRNTFNKELEDHKEIIKKMKERGKAIKELKQLKENYLEIFDRLNNLLHSDNKDDIFNEIFYIEVGEIYDIIKYKKKSDIKKVVFKDFLPIEKYITWMI